MSHDQAPLEKANLDQGKFKSNRGKLWLRIIKIFFLSVCTNTIPLAIALSCIFVLWWVWIGLLLLEIQLLFTVAVFLFLFFTSKAKLSSLIIYSSGAVLNFCVLSLLVLNFVHNITPLHVAALMGQDLLVQGLLLTGSNINSINSNGGTPLVYAVQGRHPHTVQILLEAGAEKSPDILVQAVESGEPKTVQFLIKAGANLNGVDIYERTPLCTAAEDGSVEITKLLLQAGADLNQPGNHGKTPLQLAKQLDYTDIVQLLEQAGAK